MRNTLLLPKLLSGELKAAGRRMLAEEHLATL